MIIEEEGGAPVEEENAELGEGTKVKENLSDISEEEEIKVPPKDLTGISYLLISNIS